MNVSMNFAATARVQPGYETVIGNGAAAWTILFTGQTHPDDFTTEYHYRLFDLVDPYSPEISITTDVHGNITEVQSGKLPLLAANALRLENIYVPEIWIEWPKPS